MHCRSRRRMLGILFIAGLLLSTGSIAQAGKSGITGVVILRGHGGPTPLGEPTRYYEGPMEIVRVSDKRQVASVRSDKNGKFTVELPPGTYRIVHHDPMHSQVQSLDIVVEKGKFTVAQVYADNGLR